MHTREVQQLVHHKYAQTSVRVKARQLCRRADFRACEREDVEQELWLYLLTQADKFDPQRSSLNTFIDRLVNTAAAILVRSRECEMRAAGFHAQSLDTSPRGKNRPKESLRTSLSPEDGARRASSVPKSDLDALEEREALESALASMPSDVRDLCQRVMDGQTPTAVARQLGVSRRQVRKMLDEARHHLQRAGFTKE